MAISCSSKSEENKSPDQELDNSQYTYLALGDSYTIGESVAVSDRWPVQLVQSLKRKGYEVEDPKIIAKTGWTTGNLLSAMNAELSSKKYDLVSVLIGVNNQYQGRSIEEYEADLNTIFKEAIAHSTYGKEGVFVCEHPRLRRYAFWSI